VLRLFVESVVYVFIIFVSLASLDTRGFCPYRVDRYQPTRFVSERFVLNPRPVSIAPCSSNESEVRASSHTYHRFSSTFAVLRDLARSLLPDSRNSGFKARFSRRRSPSGERI